MTTKCLLPLAFFALFISNVFAENSPSNHLLESQGCDIELILFSTLSCDGIYDLSISPNGGIPPYEYSWNGGEFDMTSNYNNLSPGTYIVVVRDSTECTETLEFTLDEPIALLEVDVTVSENTATAIPSGGVPPYTYQWDDYDAQTTATATGLSSGVIYYVTVTDASGCSAIGNVVLSVGIEQPEYLTNFNILPNPSNGKFTIDLQFEVTQRATIQVLNALGQEMYQLSDTQSHFQQTIDMQKAVAGTYFVVVRTESGRVVRRVVLI